MTIIIVGCGKVGTTLVEQLSKENHDICVIDQKAERVQSLTNTYDVMGVVGNGATYNTLNEAGIPSADILIAVTDSDEQNLLCCLFAKRVGGCATIARVRNPEYFEDIGFIKEQLGISMIINPEYAAAVEISRLLKCTSATEISAFARGKIELMKFRIQSGSVLSDLPISQIRRTLGCDILVCAVERNREVTIPGGDFVLREQDNIFVIAAPGKAGKFFKKVGLPPSPVKDAMIIGGGTIAYYLARILLTMGVQVKIIEQNKDRCEYLCDHLPKAMIINGDGVDKELLYEEGIQQTDAFITLTNLDEENILLSLLAKNLSHAKTITKISQISFDQVLENLDLGSIVYPKYITAQYILQHTRARQKTIGSNVETLYKLVNDKAEALEFFIAEDAPVIGTPLAELPLKNNLLICSINRDGKAFIPSGQDEIMVGDTVIVLTTHTGLQDIADILRSNGPFGKESDQR